MNDFLERVRGLDGDSKNRIMYISTAVIMIVIVVMWAKYFNGLVPLDSIGPDAATSTVPVATAAAPSSTPTPSSPGFWSTVETGIGEFEKGIVAGLQGFADIFTGGHQYIKPSH